MALPGTHDANGNLTGDGTWSYGYDENNRLRSASKAGTSATLAYDAEGRLRQSVVAGATLDKAYDGVALVAEYDGAGAMQSRWVHGPGVDEPIVAYSGATTANKSWLYADHLGSIVATADATGAGTALYGYGPYGESNTTAGQRFRYTGQQFMGDLGLYHYKARFYDPRLGRFLQTDPIGTQDDLNLYAYVGNNPINRNDPRGLSSQEAAYLNSSLTDSSGSVQVAQLLPVPLYLNPWTAVPAVLGTGCMLSSGCRNLILNQSEGDKDPSTPTGQRGSPMDVTDGTNEPATIGGRDYTGHSLDQMQGRGVTPTPVEDVIQNGNQTPGNKPGRIVHTSSDGRLSVVTEDGKVITVITK
ncbi:RHS repeat-associated core domain-containing protein [Alicycliphilus sp. T452]